MQICRIRIKNNPKCQRIPLSSTSRCRAWWASTWCKRNSTAYRCRTKLTPCSSPSWPTTCAPPSWTHPSTPTKRPLEIRILTLTRTNTIHVHSNLQHLPQCRIPIKSIAITFVAAQIEPKDLAATSTWTQKIIIPNNSTPTKTTTTIFTQTIPILTLILSQI